MKTFEEYLRDIHSELFPQILDDGLPDHFDNWLGDLDGQEYMDYAERYGELIYLYGKNDGMTQALDILNK